MAFSEEEYQQQLKAQGYEPSNENTNAGISGNPSAEALPVTSNSQDTESQPGIILFIIPIIVVIMIIGVGTYFLGKRKR